MLELSHEKIRLIRILGRKQPIAMASSGTKQPKICLFTVNVAVVGGGGGY